MTVEETVQQVFDENNHRWKIGDTYIVPSQDDIEKTLDKAVSMLYDKELYPNQDIGDRLEMGGMIIERRPVGFDVYVHIGLI